MESYSTYFNGVLIEVFGTYEEPEEETNFKGGFLGERIEVNGTDITALLSESIREQIDEQIAQEI
jgi:hypothetical protein